MGFLWPSSILHGKSASELEHVFATFRESLVILQVFGDEAVNQSKEQEDGHLMPK